MRERYTEGPRKGQFKPAEVVAENPPKPSHPTYDTRTPMTPEQMEKALGDMAPKVPDRPPARGLPEPLPMVDRKKAQVSALSAEYGKGEPDLYATAYESAFRCNKPFPITHLVLDVFGTVVSASMLLVFIVVYLLLIYVGVKYGAPKLFAWVNSI